MRTNFIYSNEEIVMNRSENLIFCPNMLDCFIIYHHNDTCFHLGLQNLLLQSYAAKIESDFARNNVRTASGQVKHNLKNRN